MSNPSTQNIKRHELDLESDLLRVALASFSRVSQLFGPLRLHLTASTSSSKAQSMTLQCEMTAMVDSGRSSHQATCTLAISVDKRKDGRASREKPLQSNECNDGTKYTIPKQQSYQIHLSPTLSRIMDRFVPKLAQTR